jgi:hypothetical protein
MPAAIAFNIVAAQHWDPYQLFRKDEGLVSARRGAQGKPFVSHSSYRAMGDDLYVLRLYESRSGEAVTSFTLRAMPCVDRISGSTYFCLM